MLIFQNPYNELNNFEDVMKLKSLEIIFKALNKEDVRYLIAGGLAVVAHGYVRFTADIDLILDMEEKNLKKAMRAFGLLGYQPRPPVELEDFIYHDKRSEWIREKGLTVFSLWNPKYPATEIDIFIEPPIIFEKAYASGISFEIVEGLEVKVLGINDLISLKKIAGRVKDLDDVEKLKALIEDSDND